MAAGCSVQLQASGLFAVALWYVECEAESMSGPRVQLERQNLASSTIDVALGAQLGRLTCWALLGVMVCGAGDSEAGPKILRVRFRAWA